MTRTLPPQPSAFLPFLCAILLASTQWACTQPAEGDVAEEPAETRIPVEILSLEPRPFDERFSASGVIAAEEEVTVSSEIAGRIERIRFEIGDEVRRGQLLLRLDDRSQRARVAKLEAEVARAETDLQWARRDLERQIELFETAVTAERARDDAQRMVDTSEDNLVSVKADLDIAKVELDQASIRSPLSGRVARRHVAPGEYVTPGTQLFDIVSGAAGRSLVEFVFSVSEADVIGMRPGQQIELAMDAYPQQTFAGEVSAIAPAGSQGTRTFRVELKVESTDEMPLLPGMAGRASVIRRSHDAVFLIPESAVLRDGADSYVWAIVGETAERRNVRIVSQTGTLAVLASDFDPAQGCVVLGQAAVSEGALVRVRRTHTEPPTSVFD